MTTRSYDYASDNKTLLISRELQDDLGLDWYDSQKEFTGSALYGKGDNTIGR